MNSNPLLKNFSTKFGAVPFDQIKDEHFVPAIDAAIVEAKKNIEAIKNSREKISFENVLDALELAGMRVSVIAGIFSNLHGADTNDVRQALAKEISPKLASYINDLNLDEDLFAKVSQLKDRADLLGTLSNEQKMLLESTYKDFVRNGALLNPHKKEELRAIDNELSTLALEFSDHVLAEVKKFEMYLTTKEELAGLPESVVEMAAQAAKDKGQEGKWLFTLEMPSYIALMTHSSRRDLREKMSKAFGSRANHGDELDNTKVIQRLVELRHKRAKILGYASHATYTLEKRMAESPERVHSFLEEVKGHSKQAGIRDVSEVEAYAKKLDKIDRLQRWDYSYYAEKLKLEKYAIDDELLRPYFKLENVIDGAFTVASKLFGISFKEIKDVPVYHPDVKVFEVLDEKSHAHIGLLYSDFFPRPGKRGGAWMTSFKEQHRLGGEHRPHVSIVCNFTKPTASKPSLLRFDEVTTLFHEFGHALHGLLSDCKYPSLGGTNVYWDFVELPSQIMENWCYEKDALDLFAAHYETKQKIPEDLIKKLIASSNYQEGYSSMRQLSFGFLDMAYYRDPNSYLKTPSEIEAAAMGPLNVLPPVEGTLQSSSFSHIFAGGYSSGYYSYKWAEVLDADAFESFKEEGVLSRETGMRFRKSILSKGGSEHPMELYKKFKGREPSVIALLKRGGLI